MAVLRTMENYNQAKPEPVTGPLHRPQSISEIDVRQSVLEDLVLKILYLSGSIFCSRTF